MICIPIRQSFWWDLIGKAHTMEMLVIEEDMVGSHVFLQDLARCPRGVIPHI